LEEKEEEIFPNNLLAKTTIKGYLLLSRRGEFFRRKSQRKKRGNIERLREKL